ncbi:XRE family transcriptional regulator [Rothia nasimurium]|uniref:XRE family transcriptional regulator n=1 Tax=Rothia nasimurium TaxID=85336 RepID=UPI00162444F7|nr:XRE family transcriptional regulator [Rothia nasimurium]
MPRELLKRSGIAHLWNKDPAAVSRYTLPEPDAVAIGKNGKEESLWERATIEKWFTEQFTGPGRPKKKD